MADHVELDGSRTLVLGGSGALGSLIARELARRGSRIALAGRDPERLRVTAEGLDGAPTIVFDLRSPADNRRVVAETVRELGGIDGIVNAAGVVAFGPLADMADAALADLFAIDLIGPLQVIKAAIPEMDDGGFVVNLTGVVAESPVANIAAYSAAKAGLSAAGAALNRELRRTHVHFLDVRPPHVETGLASRAIAGTAPRMPEGLDPETVATRVVDALVAGERELPAASFS